MHRLGETHASTTYWVHDIVHMKRAAEGKLLPSLADYKVGEDDTPGKRKLRARRK